MPQSSHLHTAVRLIGLTGPAWAGPALGYSPPCSSTAARSPRSHRALLRQRTTAPLCRRGQVKRTFIGYTKAAAVQVQKDWLATCTSCAQRRGGGTARAAAAAAVPPNKVAQKSGQEMKQGGSNKDGRVLLPAPQAEGTACDGPHHRVGHALAWPAAQDKARAAPSRRAFHSCWWVRKRSNMARDSAGLSSGTCSRRPTF